MTATPPRPTESTFFTAAGAAYTISKNGQITVPPGFTLMDKSNAAQLSDGFAAAALKDSLSKSWRRLDSLARMVAASFVLCCLNGVAAADDREDFESQLRSLYSTATNVTLLVVPKGLLFRAAVTEERLPQTACLYDVASHGGASFKAILELLERSVYPDEARSALQSPFDIRIGLIFKNGGGVVQKFYFEDSIGGRTVRGYSAWKERSNRLRLAALGDFPDLLRAFGARPDVIGGDKNTCGRP
jgi:hypothetical protein